MKTLLRLAFAAALGLAPLAFGADQAAARDSRRDTFSLRSKATGDEYVLRVSFPEGYHASSSAYPLLLMLDGEYAFHATADISAYLQREGAVRPYVVVGVSYDVGFGPPLAAKRSRDFTPPTDEAGVIKKAPAPYHAFLKEELLPALKARYRIQPGDLTLWSYSLSGALALWLNYYDRALFDHYLIASPNMSYGILEKLMAGEVLHNAEGARAKKVMLSLDRSETADPDRYFKPGSTELVDPLKQMLAQFQGYQVSFHGTQGESHASSWFVSLPRGLRFVFSGAKQEHGSVAK